MGNDEEIEIIDLEDPEEENMEIDDIAAEPITSSSIKRCGYCRRVQYGHPVPYGAGKCLLEKINDDELKNDDKIKLEMRKSKRGRKKKRLSDESSVEPSPKKDKIQSEEQMKKETEDLERKLEKRRRKERMQKTI